MHNAESSSRKATVLVVGASGIVGRAALEHFTGLPDVRAIGLSRRPPEQLDCEHVALDLQDKAACERAAGAFAEVTHVVYAALFEKPGLLAGWTEQDQMQTNLQMLQNLLVPLQQQAKNLTHISLLQGTKAYGAHVGPMRVPGRESEPRVEHDNFYWLQEDWLKAQRANAEWSLTIWRPPLIVGHAFGAPMNVLGVIGLYGALAQAHPQQASRGFGWPGGVCGPIDAVDARLLAEGFAWAAGLHGVRDGKSDGKSDGSSAAADETFNISNGDVFVPSTVWPRLASAFGLSKGADEPQSLQETLPAQGAVWDALVQRFALKAPDLAGFAGDSLIYTDMFFNAGNTVPMPSPLLSTIKLRKAGFVACMDSETMLVDWLEALRQQQVLPPQGPIAL